MFLVKSSACPWEIIMVNILKVLQEGSHSQHRDTSFSALRNLQ